MSTGLVMLEFLITNQAVTINSVFEQVCKLICMPDVSSIHTVVSRRLTYMDSWMQVGVVCLVK